MPTQATLFEASLFAVVGLILAFFTQRIAPPLRKTMFNMVLVIAVGMLGLYALTKLGGPVADTTLAVVVREVSFLLVAVGVTLILLMFLFQAVLAKAGLPRILADVMLVLLLIAFVLYRMNSSGVNLASIITTSAVITGVIAFSLQETLGNLWGGIALQLDNTCRIGDWIRVAGVTGKIVDIRWRCLAVATNDGETVMIPNAQLIKNQVTVLARRGDQKIPYRRRVDFPVSYDVPPSRVMAAMQAALARVEIPFVAAEPAPICTCSTFGDQSITYQILYWLTDLSHDVATDSQIHAHVFAALSRHGMEIPLPRRVVLTPRALNAQRADAAQRELAGRLDVLAHIELFAALNEGERRALAAELAEAPYLAGDVISREGETSDSLFILARGTVAVFHQGDAAGEARTHLADLDAPSYFGEMGLLTGQARTATVVAKGEVLCYQLQRSGFDAILRARPALVESLSHTVAARQAANVATLQALSDEARRKLASGRVPDLVRRIREFFRLSTPPAA
jgi:small-conductance mechanosensitive channel/CRP-like cAMP-binding protein